MRVIEAGTLRLEPLTAAHAEEMFVVLGDPAIYEHENEPPPSLHWLSERYARLESRASADGREQWLNWVIRIPTFELIGFVQATVYVDGRAAIAYELSSSYWGRGLARQAVQAMIAELSENYRVRSLTAVLKQSNLRSRGLLVRLGFSLVSPGEELEHRIEADEILMRRALQGNLHRQTQGEATMFGNSDTIRNVYAAFARGDVPAVLSALAPDVSWTEAEGFPYGGTYIGPDAVLKHVFMRLGTEWNGFAAVAHEFISEGDAVVALGEYSGRYKATGKHFATPFVHVWKFHNGKVATFRQHTDTAVVQRALS